MIRSLTLHPTRRALRWFGAAGALAFLPVLLAPGLWPAWAAAVVALFALALVDALRIPAPDGFACAIDGPDVLFPGQPAAGLARVSLAGAGDLPVEVALDAAGTLEPPARLAGALAGGSAVLPFPLRAGRRGAARITEAWLSYAGPLGLVAATARRPVAFERPVVPDLRPVERDALRFFRERNLRAGIKIERYVGEGTEFDSLRGFALGDDPRAVHWKASARHRVLLTRQYRAERNHQIVLALDTGRLMGELIGPLPRLGDAPTAVDALLPRLGHAPTAADALLPRLDQAPTSVDALLPRLDQAPTGAGPLPRLDDAPTAAGPLPRLDHALTAALLLAFVALAGGDRVGMFTFGARVGPGLAPVGGIAAFPRLRLFTSALADRPEETNFTLGLTTLASSLRRRSLVIVLTEFVDTVSAELMVENVARLAARHLVVFVALRDPSLDALAAARPANPLGLHRAVIADGLVREREAVLRHLERLGVATLDAVPDAVGPALVNRYLDIRRRERI